MSPLRKRLPGIASGRAALVAGLIAGITPPAEMTVAEWAEQERKVSAESGSPYPGDWSNDLAPYGVEVMECMSFSDPCRQVTLVKSHQVAGTEFGVNLAGYVIDKHPSPIVIVLPTIDEGSKYERVKLAPTIEATPALKHRVKTERSRSREGSTMAFKRFRGGFLQVTGANSSTGLQMISCRVLIAEEISEWPLDAGNRGDPLAQVEKRLTAWSQKKPKRYYGSTPGVTGECRITEKYEASDQRRYYVPCPHCGTFQVLNWGNMKWRNTTAPIHAYMVCAAHGCIIEHFEKKAMVVAGVWIKTYEDGGAEPGRTIDPEDLQRYRDRPSNGREPGFHIWQAYSPFVTWDDTVAEWLESEGKPLKEKTFTQQVLGEAYKESGEAPDYEKLLLRREPYALGTLPPSVLVLTAMADVQKWGIVWGVYGWGIGMNGWLVDKGIVECDPSHIDAWQPMDAVVSKHYETWNGHVLPIEAFGVDSGYLSNTVYLFTRRYDRVFALDGRDGWQTPPIGTPSKKQVKWNGRPVKGGVLLWPTGTWSLKSHFYAALRKTIQGPNVDGNWPIGCIRFPDACDEAFFKEATAEYLKETQRYGRTVQVWDKARDQANEQLDIAVGALAMAAHLRLMDMSNERWRALAEERGAPPEQAQKDLAALWAPKPVDQAARPSSSADGGERRSLAERLANLNRD